MGPSAPLKTVFSEGKWKLFGFSSVLGVGIVLAFESGFLILENPYCMFTVCLVRRLWLYILGITYLIMYFLAPFIRSTSSNFSIIQTKHPTKIIRSTTFYFIPSLYYILANQIINTRFLLFNAYPWLVCIVLSVMSPNSVSFLPIRHTLHYLSLQRNNLWHPKPDPLQP